MNSIHTIRINTIETEYRLTGFCHIFIIRHLPYGKCEKSTNTFRLIMDMNIGHWTLTYAFSFYLTLNTFYIDTILHSKYNINKNQESTTFTYDIYFFFVTFFKLFIFCLALLVEFVFVLTLFNGFHL